MSTSTAIAIREDQTTFDDLQKRALVHLGVDRAGDADLAVFFHTCKRTGLDPFARQIFMIERQGKQTIQTGIDGLRLIAQRTTERTRGTLGYEDTQWCGQDGVWRDVWLSTEPPSAARVAVIRNGQRFPAIALFHEYAGRKRDGNLMQMWATKGALMLAKCAEALALRKAFPQDLSGVYTTDEMQQAEAAAPAPRKATGTDALRAAVAPAPQPTPEPEPDWELVDAEVVDEQPAPPLDGGAGITQAQSKMLHAALNEAGMGDRDAGLAYISDVLDREVTSSKELSKADASKVIDSLVTEVPA